MSYVHNYCWCHCAAGVADVLSTIIGAEMLKIVPGRVSTEVRGTEGREAVVQPQAAAGNTLAATLSVLGRSSSGMHCHSYRCAWLLTVCCSAALQVDAHMSYDSKATYDKVSSLIAACCSNTPYFLMANATEVGLHARLLCSWRNPPLNRWPPGTSHCAGVFSLSCVVAALSCRIAKKRVVRTLCRRCV
jgi:hypothetical protein